MKDPLFIIFNGEKNQSFPSGQEHDRLSTLTTVIQHSIGSFSLCNQTTQRNKRHPQWPGEVKLSLFADDMILYMENSKDSTKNMLELIYEFSKVQDIKPMHRAWLHSYTTTMKQQKEKSRNQSLLELHQKP